MMLISTSVTRRWWFIGQTWKLHQDILCTVVDTEGLELSLKMWLWTPRCTVKCFCHTVILKTGKWNTRKTDTQIQYVKSQGMLTWGSKIKEIKCTRLVKKDWLLILLQVLASFYLFPMSFYVPAEMLSPQRASQPWLLCQGGTSNNLRLENSAILGPSVCLGKPSLTSENVFGSPPDNTLLLSKLCSGHFCLMKSALIRKGQQRSTFHISLSDIGLCTYCSYKQWRSANDRLLVNSRLFLEVVKGGLKTLQHFKQERMKNKIKATIRPGL